MKFAAGILGAILSVAVGIYVYANIFPGAASTLSNTTGWGTTNTAVITLGTVVVLIVAVVGLLGHFVGGKSSL